MTLRVRISPLPTSILHTINTMKEIRLQKSTDKIIGSLRCSTRVFEKLEEMATTNNVTKQEIVRAILEEFIDEIKFK